MTDKKLQQMKAIRWDEDDWGMLATLAAKFGLTRSAFIKQATLGEAARVLAGGVPYFVGRPTVGIQNTHTSNSDPLSLIQGDGNDGVVSRRCKRGVAKGTDEANLKKQRPKG